MTRHLRTKHRAAGVFAAAAICAFALTAQAHHSFAMYDQDKTYVMTGVVVRVDPNPNHLQIFFVPLNEAREQIVRDEKGEPWVWALEMDAAAVVARDGITVNNFPRGTIISVGTASVTHRFAGRRPRQERTVQVPRRYAASAGQALRFRKRLHIARPGRSS